MTDHNGNHSSYESIHAESKVIPEGTGFTQINNNVINNIKNGDAFLVWCYLYSKTSNWKTIKENIKNVYGFGDGKLKQIFSYLNRAKLIKYVQTKCANGKFAPVQICILNGAKFDKTQAWLECAPVVQKTAPAVNRTNGNDELRNKDITKQRKTLNTKSNSATNVAQPLKDESFNIFWNEYPIKKNKVRAQKIWKRNGYHESLKLIINDIRARKDQDSQWQDKQFIPHPSTYLQNQLWTDEITLRTNNSSKNEPDAYTSVMDKYRNSKGATYDQHGNTIDPLR